MPDNLTQVGVGGLLALAVIKMILDFLGKQKASIVKETPHIDAAGSRPTEYWQMEYRRAVAEVVHASITPILNTQTEILRELQRNQSKVMDVLLKRFRP